MFDNIAFRRFVFAATSLVTHSRLAPWSLWLATDWRLAFSTTMWVIDRIHTDTTVGRFDTEPSRASSSTQSDILRIGVAAGVQNVFMVSLYLEVED